MNEVTIEAKNLTKSYRKLLAVDNVSFKIYKEEFLVGLNSAGKTIIVDILDCLRNPTNGFAKVLCYKIITQEKVLNKFKN